ncbi:homeobox protein knotted-1-like 2 [Lolium perenne]|uniref:homeobox protein knotted-1-like 2 n=1 Tax=Lolium perenne TaxID=4522 RepID=UPI0021F637F7|nr:homeobox protein knotted-1-like 2 [Lolium perenne]
MDVAPAATSSPKPSFSQSGSNDSAEREKKAVAAHPLHERLLEDHVACFRVATPGAQLPRIDSQIAARPPPLVAAIEIVGGPSNLRRRHLRPFHRRSHRFHSLHRGASVLVQEPSKLSTS